MVAFGVGRWPEGSSNTFNWKLLLLVFVSLFLLRFLVRLEIHWPTAFAALGIGTLWGWLVDWWGVLPPTALVLLLMILAASTVDRIRRRPA